MMKECIYCEKEKNITEFYKDRKMADGYRSNCKECHKETEIARHQKNYINNPRKPRELIIRPRRRGRRSTEEKSLAARRYRLQKEYGITIEQYEDQYEKQKGLCKICKKYCEKLSIDHCHQRGEVRGLICHQCNVGLGMFMDNINHLRSAIEYLEDPGIFEAHS